MIDETYLELQPQEEKAEEKKVGTDCPPLITKLRAELERQEKSFKTWTEAHVIGRYWQVKETLALLNELEDKNTITGVFDNAEDLMKHLDSLKEKEQPETDELIKENIRVMDEQDGNISTLAPEELKPLAWDWLEIIEDCAEKSSGKESEYDKYLIDALWDQIQLLTERVNLISKR